MTGQNIFVDDGFSL
ncbi:hypothetical protein [Aeromonas veronii]|nr:hypothetical protein [Aeromonas veronii]